ncbi:MAG: hypothetical protein A3I66_12155 [Burkholderiales bacterium RIFCSPLOWO2_02_FULL_57_36]|nr:MAG: hypothetical protein A3I66_12155 [Burkholderiales bacterium RIFCSPLOWO2_02_FULL_57_36]
MVKITQVCISALAAGLLLLNLSGCQKTESTAEEAPAQKGTAEKVGEQIDQAATEAARHLNKLADDAGKGIEKAGESLQRETKDAPKEGAQTKESQAQEEQK